MESSTPDPETLHNEENIEENTSAEEDLSEQEFKPFSVRKFLLVMSGSLFAIFAIIFLIGFVSALNGTRPASFDNEIIQRQLDGLLNNTDEEYIPNELEKNE